MTTLIGRGRPAIPGQATTLRLNDECFKIMEAGSERMAALQASSPSRAAWFRGLIDFAFHGTLIEHTMTASLLADRWPQTWIDQPKPHNVTVLLKEQQRILLRQFECYVQSLDWTREIYRNEAAQILMAAHGPVFNRAMEVEQRQKERKGTSPHPGE